VKFECTNCAGIGPEFWITLGALAIAAGALVIAFREHREYMKQLQARARFTLRLRPLRADDDGVIHTKGSKAYVIVEIGLKNDGNRAAGPTVINVVAPRHLETLRFCGPSGEELPATQAPAEAAETLVDAQGGRMSSKFLSTELPRVSLRPHYLKFARFPVDVPDQGEANVPLRVTAQADELPDDVSEVSERLLVRVVRTKFAP